MTVLNEAELRGTLEEQVRNMHTQIADLMKQIHERDDAMGKMREHLADLTSYCMGRAECGDAHPEEATVCLEVARQLNEIRQGSGPHEQAVYGVNKAGL